MKSLLIWLLWTVVIIGVCVAGDQFLLRGSVKSPIFAAAQTFYKDFRGRIINLARKEELHLEGVKEKWPPAVPPAVLDKIKPLVQSEPAAGGYVYIDKDGGLHLTTTLEEVPKEYRSAAKALEK